MAGYFDKKNFYKAFGFNYLSSEDYKKRTMAIQLAAITIMAGLLHSLVYALMGFPYVTVAVLGYAVACIMGLLYLRLTHNFEVFKIILLGLCAVAPVITQLTIGGYISSSAVIVGSFFAPVGALFYASKQTARKFFYVFLFFLVVAAVTESVFDLTNHQLPAFIILIFFPLNIAFTLGSIYYLMETFVRKQMELRHELQSSLQSLQETQQQLIQREKMASLGELTAGIAHEIQNPLNFVNNFAEVSLELLAELVENQQAAEPDPETEKSLLADLQQNLIKIHHHGQRADGIVKGMLQHSRTSTGQKEAININALADEYLRLSYHGLRAKDKSFNAKLVTNFAEPAPLVAVIPQDLGRVLLNLFNNAFYATQEKKQQLKSDYLPEVQVSTQYQNNHVEIKVRDNGSGIPESLQQKIFQPFFTTKPAGQGTGLGLSLSYDIITKGHGGNFKLVTQAGEFSEFIITLPFFNQNINPQNS